MLYARISPLVSVLLLVAPLGACAREEGEEQAAAADPASADSASVTMNNASVLKNPDTATWTAGLTAKPGDSIRTLSAVRTAQHERFERIVFEFAEAGIPGYHLEYIDKPVRQCGSGEPVPLPGDAWLLIQLEPANAHTEEGKATVADRNRAPGYPNLKRLQLICDFEAVVAWVAAVASPNRYRTLELSNPARLVVDIRR